MREGIGLLIWLWIPRSPRHWDNRGLGEGSRGELFVVMDTGGDGDEGSLGRGSASGAGMHLWEVASHARFRVGCLKFCLHIPLRPGGFRSH
jgi:hypothetical protein